MVQLKHWFAEKNIQQLTRNGMIIPRYPKYVYRNTTMHFQVRFFLFGFSRFVPIEIQQLDSGFLMRPWPFLELKKMTEIPIPIMFEAPSFLCNKWLLLVDYCWEMIFDWWSRKIWVIFSMMVNCWFGWDPRDTPKLTIPFTKSWCWWGSCSRWLI